MKLTMLGTGNALVTECYNTCFVISDGNAKIYGHAEVLSLLEDIAKKLLQPKETAFIGKRLHFVPVADGEVVNVIDHATTFF